jgi:hypothetical protein
VEDSTHKVTDMQRRLEVDQVSSLKERESSHQDRERQILSVRISA